jgi:hypothetical protein
MLNRKYTTRTDRAKKIIIVARAEWLIPLFRYELSGILEQVNPLWDLS